MAVARQQRDEGLDAALASQLKDRATQHKKEVGLVHEAFGFIKDLAVIFERDHVGDKVDECRELGRQLLDLHAKLDCNLIILNELSAGQHSRAGDEALAYMARRIQELDQSRTPDGYTQHEQWVALRQEIWDVHHAGEPLPEQAGDELVVMRKATGAQTCPITQGPLEEPVRCTTCKHTYSKQAVENYIKRKRNGQAQCPVAGCSEIITLATLERDVDAERALAKAKQGAKRKATKQSLDLI